MYTNVCTPLPLCSWGCDTDNHDSGIGQDLLESLIVFAFLKVVAQLLKTKSPQHKKQNCSWHYYSQVPEKRLFVPGCISYKRLPFLRTFTVRI